MNLGAFSVSLAVKDIHASKTFYEKLGFTVFHGDITQNWLILKNGTTVIGLFQGMFPANLLTFNPKWDNSAQTVEGAPDIREIQKSLKAQGVVVEKGVDESTSGPGSFTVTDPDGNVILLDQHV
jgi:lactoylglutathione lyase